LTSYKVTIRERDLRLSGSL